MWGNVRPDGERHNASTLQTWVDKVLSVLIEELEAPPSPPPPPNPWASISPMLLNEPIEHFPTLPTLTAAANLYGSVSQTHSRGYPFTAYTVSVSEGGASPTDDGVSTDVASALCNASASTTDLVPAVTAGPLMTCAAGACSGPPTGGTGSQHCRAGFNSPSIELSSGRAGTHWATALATPTWAQFTFPATPVGTTHLTMRYKLDSRYRPELYGGNACANASDLYNCSLCIFDGECKWSSPAQSWQCSGDDSWDFKQEPGFYALWSAAGRDAYVVTGPHDVTNDGKYDADVHTRTLDAPSSLAILPGDYPVVTFLTYSQYSAFGEVSRDSSKRCSISWSDQSGHAFKNHPLMIQSTTLLYRQGASLPTQPPLSRPRLYGVDTIWYPHRVRTFLDAPCDPEAAASGGWFESAGVNDLKNRFDLAARSFSSCTCTRTCIPDGSDIGRHAAARKFLHYDTSAKPSYIDGRRALHLVRRVWACGEANSGSFDTCEYNGTEATRLAEAIVSVEMARFDSLAWSCGVVCGGDGGAAFDLDTATPVSYFSLWYDVLLSKPGLVPASNASHVAATLRLQIDLFRDAFWYGGWTLWNGNNWTPHLTIAALMWAVAFFHEDAAAREVVQMVNDILWLHRSYYTSDGVYKEGVVQYSMMSITGLIQAAIVQNASFGAPPDAIDVLALRNVVKYHLASMDSSGYAIDFGDSWANRGWSSVQTLEAAMAARIVSGVPLSVLDAAIDGCQVRAFSASIYGSGGIYEDPWQLVPELFELELGKRAKNCSLTSARSQPLGGAVTELFQAGHYAAMRLPLLPASDGASPPPCFGSGSSERCIDATKPSIFDNVPYTSLALQARPNSWAHSEVDFGTIVWSAWGSRLLSDFGYGTIATSVGQWDTRRYSAIDNNPAGHNTVLIREAFGDGEGGACAPAGGGGVCKGNTSDINFSQMNQEEGSALMANVTRDDEREDERDGSIGPAESCILLDGSALYGRDRPDGWLRTMNRYACPLSVDASVAGAFVLVDLLAVKAQRHPLSIYGAQYGGPNFNEPSPASKQLHVEEYFHSGTGADLVTNPELGDGHYLPEEIPFDKAALGSKAKWCTHVDIDVTSQGADAGANNLVVLRPACGIGSYRDPDGLGAIAAYATRGGHFIRDGLVTAPDRWSRAHWLKMRRFRFVGERPLDTEGDVRAFVLAPAPAHNRSAAPYIRMSSCSADLGCATAASPLDCSCISLCVGTTMSWAAVLVGELRLLRVVGRCGDGSVDGAAALNATLVGKFRELANLDLVPPGAPAPAAPAPSAAPPLSYPVSVPGGRLTLPPSEEGVLITLSKVINATGAAVPVARSYDGHPWEALSTTPLELGLPQSSAEVDLLAAMGVAFRLDRYAASRADRNSSDDTRERVKRAAARLLMQATYGESPRLDHCGPFDLVLSISMPTASDFASPPTARCNLGPTLAELRGPLANDSSTPAVRAWVAEQMALPPSLLRAHMRRRVNPRIPNIGETTVGRVRVPCEAGARYHPYAFTTRDVGKTLTVRRAGVGLAELVVENETRTELALPNYAALSIKASTCTGLYARL